MTPTETLLVCCLRNLVDNGHLECYCGNEPYVDGEQCPACIAIYTLEQIEHKSELTPVGNPPSL